MGRLVQFDENSLPNEMSEHKGANVPHCSKKSWQPRRLSLASIRQLEGFVEYFGSRLIDFDEVTYANHQLPEEQRRELTEIVNDQTIPAEGRVQAQVRLYWENTRHEQLYSEIIDKLDGFASRSLKQRAIEECNWFIIQGRGIETALNALSAYFKSIGDVSSELFWSFAARKV
jgi:hypothetical protein